MYEMKSKAEQGTLRRVAEGEHYHQHTRTPSHH